MSTFSERRAALTEIQGVIVAAKKAKNNAVSSLAQQLAVLVAMSATYGPVMADIEAETATDAASKLQKAEATLLTSEFLADKDALQAIVDAINGG